MSSTDHSPLISGGSREADSEPGGILQSLNSTEAHSAAELLPMVYRELRGLAAAKMSGERADHTLQATELVHEAWIKLTGTDASGRKWTGRRHFFAAAAEAMRYILIDHARRKMARRHGGGLLRVTLGDHIDPIGIDPSALVDLDSALIGLARDDPPEAELANLRIFAGLSIPATAEVLGVSPATVKRRWSYVRARLGRHLREETR